MLLQKESNCYMEKAFAKAFDEQRKEFLAVQRNSSAPSTSQHSNSALNLFTYPVSMMPGMILIV